MLAIYMAGDAIRAPCLIGRKKATAWVALVGAQKTGLRLCRVRVDAFLDCH